MPKEFIEILSEDKKVETFAIEVLEAGVTVSPANARRFVTSILNKKLTIDGEKIPARIFTALPIESRLALYEAIAEEDHADRYQLLTKINRFFMIFKDFNVAYEALAKAHAESFFDNKEKIELLWQQASQHVCSFGETMHRFINDPASVKHAEKKEVFSFLVREYAAHNNLYPHEAIFYKAQRANIGASWRLSRFIGINTRGRDFLNEPHKLASTVAHEIEHKLQMQLAFQFWKGSIPDTSELYNVAWVMRANLFTPFGYLNGEGATKKNWLPAFHYMEQPSECGARASEELVEKLVRKNWQHKL